MVGCRGRGENMVANVGAMSGVGREKRKRRCKGRLEGKEVEAKMGCHAEDIYVYATAGRVLRYWEKTDVLLSENEPPESS